MVYCQGAEQACKQVSYWYMSMPATKHLVQAGGAEQAYHLRLLIRSHAGKHHRVLQHSLQDGKILLLQQVLKGSSRDGTLCLSLRYSGQGSGGLTVQSDVSGAQEEALPIALQAEVR